MNKRILYLIQQAGMLLEMPRSHIRNLGNNASDTVASHSFQVAVIAYCIARMEGLSHQEGLEAMAMGVLHDLAEARTGDADFVAKHYAKLDETKALHDQFANIEFGGDLLAMMEVYEQRTSVVAKCAKDADVIGQMYLEWSLAWRGNKLAERWFEGDFSHRVPYLRTESAKQLALAMKDSDPQEWWRSEFTGKNIDLDLLNSVRKT